MAKSEKAPGANGSHNEDANIVSNAGGQVPRMYGREYSNGKQHWYLENVDKGDNPHISEDEMLENFGYTKADQPDRPLTIAQPEDYVVPVDPAEPEPTPEPSPEPEPEPVPPEPDPADPEQERVKEALIQKLYEDMDFMTDVAVEFERSGDTDKRDKAFWRYAEMFKTLGELEGWDPSEQARRLESWRALVTHMLLPRPGVADPTPDPDADPLDPDADPATAAAEAAANERARLIVEKSAELTALSSRLDDSRNKLAKLNVEASGRIRIGGKLKAELAAARDEWEELQKEVGAKTMAHVLLLEEGASLDQLTGFAALGAQGEAKALSQAQLDAMAAGPDGGRVKKFMHKYAKTYNSSGRIKKAFMLAPAGLVVGVGLGTIVGAIGGGIAGAIIARGAVKGALTAKMQSLQAKDGKDLSVTDFGRLLSASDASRIPDLLALRAATRNRVHTETEVSANSKENKKRAGKAVAIGSIVGIASGIVANHLMDQDLGRGGGALEKTTGHRPHPIGGGYDHETPGGTGTIDPPLPPPGPPTGGFNPETGDLFRSDIQMPVLDGQGFITDVESAGLVPKGYGTALANFLHERGFDNGAHIPGFKDMGMWHTETGYSPWSVDATNALAEFKLANGI